MSEKIGEAQLVVKLNDARLRARSGQYLLGDIQGFEVENPYALIIAVTLSEELRVRVDVTSDMLALELRKWMDGSELNNPAWIGSIARTNKVMEGYVKFGKAPTQEDLVKWILSRCELDISASPGLRFGVAKEIDMDATKGEDEDKVRSEYGGALVDNPYDATVKAAKLETGQSTSSLPRMPTRALGTTRGPKEEKYARTQKLTQEILGKSQALEKLRGSQEHSGEKFNWTGEHYLVGAFIERGRKRVENAIDERRRAMMVANIDKKRSVKRYSDTRAEIEGSAGTAQWLRDAEQELVKLQMIENNVQEDLRRQRGKAHREKQRTIWQLAPNGYANLRGKSMPGPKLGNGPLPPDATMPLQDPRREVAYGRYYWDTMGRKHQKDPELITTLAQQNAVKTAMDAIRRASSSAYVGKLDMKEVFEAMDTSGDNMLEKDELLDGLAAVGAHLNAEEADALFAHFDPNGSGKVDYGEFLWAFFNRRSFVRRWTRNTQGMTEDQLRAVFHRSDTNGDGKLGPKEFKKLLKNLNINLSDGDQDLVMKQFIALDKDGDHKLDLDELRAFIEKEKSDLEKLSAEQAAASEVAPPSPNKLKGRFPRPHSAPDSPHAKTAPALGALSVSGRNVADTKARTSDGVVSQMAEEKANYDYSVRDVYDSIIRDADKAGEGQTWIVNALKAQANIEQKLGSNYYPDKK